MMTRALLSLAVAAPLAFAQFSGWFKKDVFAPANRLSGIGADREKISEAVLTKRTQLMIDSQTFAIMRDPEALTGAQRITGPDSRRFSTTRAARAGCLPLLSRLSRIWKAGAIRKRKAGLDRRASCRSQGRLRALWALKMVYQTRYKISTERKLVRPRKGAKPVWRTVRRKIPYTVLVRDERLYPERAVPAAAQYLARLENRYGGRDWAVFAYHCGEGCAGEVRAIAQRTNGFGDKLSVAQVFFGATPAHNRELYQTLRYHMDRDFSPTYYFRISRAEELLKLYKESPDEFKKLYYEYRNQVDPTQRAPHRLSVWLRPQDLAFKNCDDLRREQGKSLVSVFDNPKYFGFTLRRTGPGSIGEEDPTNQDLYFRLHRPPSARSPTLRTRRAGYSRR